MKTVHFFLGADLRGSHAGLAMQAKQKNIDLAKLKAGEAVVFINRKKNKLKSYSFNGVVSYVRFDDSRRGIDMDALNEIPRSFTSDGRMDYERALRETLKKKLSLKRFEELEVVGK